MGCPLIDEGGALLIVNAENENEVREKIRHDPWYEHGFLKLESIRHWQIFIDMRQ
jgi:uncharacterized protein YciI